MKRLGSRYQERAQELVSRMTLEEKVSQLLHNASAIDRLDIPTYNWWNECLHGVGRAGVASVFPTAIAMAATFDPELLFAVATAISDEARAKHHVNAARGNHAAYFGLTFWTPNINLFRDPRWGRGHETYGECPYLTGQMGATFVRAIQGDDPDYLKLVATPKHFAVHSGPEGLRHEFDARVSEKDLWESYLPHFREAIVEAGAWSVMGAYNRTNGEPCCGSQALLVDILRERWGFDGYVVSDCWAVQDFHQHHKVTSSFEESAALALKNGCDLNCGCSYAYLLKALEQGLVTEEQIDRATTRCIEARFALGMFDPPTQVRWTQISYDIVDCEAHRELSREAAERSVVLLKNDRAVLPLSSEVKTIAVIGPNAHYPASLLGNYNGVPSKSVTPLEGIRLRAPEGTRVLYQVGCWHQARDFNLAIEEAASFYAEAVIAAERADVVIFVGGLNPTIEGEQGDAGNSDAGGDRSDIQLPAVQRELLKRLHATGTPVVLVVMSGSAVSIGWERDHLPAILQQFYPGQEGGTALAQVLFGDTSPGGKLPVTIYSGNDQLPPFEDYAMEGRTYRFLKSEPLYPFGFGLSYAEFVYSGIRTVRHPVTIGDPVELSVLVTNCGPVAGDEVVQVYAWRDEASVRVPIRQLVGFSRLNLDPGESRRVEFVIRPRELALVADNGRSFLEAGMVHFAIGGSQPDDLSRRLGAPEPQFINVQLVGDRVELPW
jgi:beta-glucosidase